ncbi:MAG: MAC/perforin domain-containing protein [Acidobacteriota bacterium]
MSNRLPGLSSLGYGFNIDGRFSDQSKLFQLFQVEEGEAATFSYTYPNGPTVEYTYPSNVDVTQINNFDGSSQIFAGREQFSQHFEAEANMNLKVGDRLVGFTGQFGASYSNTQSSDSEYWFGLYQDNAWLWEVDLPSPGPANLLQSVLDDPVYQNVPDEWIEGDLENNALFYRFFAKYGTYFIRSVTTGGRLYYNVIVERSAYSSTSEMSAQLDAEFKAYFVKTGAQAQAQWEQVSDQWMASRQVQMEVLGGTPEILQALTAPSRGENFNSVYKGWLDSLPIHPANVSFKLAPVSVAFEGAREAAVAKAMTVYLQSSVMVESRYQDTTIFVDGSYAQPSNGAPRAKYSGFQAAVVDEHMNVQLSKIYQAPWEEIASEYAVLYNQLLADLEPYQTSDYVIGFGTFGLQSLFFPPFELVQLLKSLGAGSGLMNWEGYANSGFYASELTQCNYALVGVPGSGQFSGFERFAVSHNVNTSSMTPGGFDGTSSFRTPASSVAVLARVHRELGFGPGTTTMALGPQSVWSSAEPSAETAPKPAAELVGA